MNGSGMMDGAQAFHRWVSETPPHEIRAMIQTGQNLREILRTARGDPRLTAWEEAFLASLAARVWNAWGLINLTERQCKVLLQITDKIAAPMPDLDQEDL
jgi:hypothetical protein